MGQGKPDDMSAGMPDDMGRTLRTLRRYHSEVLSTAPLDRIIDSLSNCAHEWKSNPEWEIHANRYGKGIFAPSHTRVSLQALLESLERDRLWDLVRSEGVGERRGYPVIGHIIASTTPLLGFVSITRALLVRSASYVKLPANLSPWTSFFVDILHRVDRDLARCIRLENWSRQNTDRTAALCEVVDLLVAYGSDETIERLRSIRNGRPFLGYGHRVSFGLVLPDADLTAAADGFALDVLQYDQGGCLSPHSIYVAGGDDRAVEFAAELADALARHAISLPLPNRTEAAAVSIQRAKTLARMDGCEIWEDPALRWSVILRKSANSPTEGEGPAGGEFAISPTHGVISVQRLASTVDLPRAVSSVSGMLQGCGVAGSISDDLTEMLSSLGVSYICQAGRMQAPPLSWPEDGLPVLRSLL